MIGRYLKVVQIMAAFETEEQAKTEIERMMREIMQHGQTSLVIYGTADDIVTGKLS